MVAQRRAAGPAAGPGEQPFRQTLPVVAVLPYQGQDELIVRRHFTDGVTADLIGALGRLHELQVIAASTMLRFRDASIEARSIGAELGADYVLAGRIDRSDQTLTFTQCLRDARSGETLWEDIVEAGIDQLFELQHRIVARVVNGILPHLRDAEIERAMHKWPNGLTAYDLTLQAVPAIRELKRSGFAQSERLIQEAHRLDRSYAMPLAWGARLHSLRVGQGWSEDRERDTASALQLSKAAIACDPTNSLALSTAAHLHSYLHRDYDTALTLFARALDASPSDAHALGLASMTCSYIGRPDEARLHAEQAIRLSPLDHAIHSFYGSLGFAHYMSGAFEAAEHWARKGYAEMPRYTSHHKVLAAALVAQGRIAEARQVGAEIRRLEPGFATAPRRSPIKDPVDREQFFTRLQTAGALAMPPSAADA